MSKESASHHNAEITHSPLQAEAQAKTEAEGVGDRNGGRAAGDESGGGGGRR